MVHSRKKFIMGGLTEADDIKMTDLSSEDQIIKQVEESDHMEEDQKMVTEVDNIDGNNDETEFDERITPSCDVIPQIQVVDESVFPTAEKESLDLNSQNKIILDVKEDALIFADNSDDTVSIISLKEESTDGLCQNTQQVEDIVSVSSIETGPEIQSNIEAAAADGEAGTGDNSSISGGDQRETSPSPVTMAEEATVASSDDIQPQEDTDTAAREAEEAKRKEEELQRKAEEEAIQKAAAEEEARRKQEAQERAKREEEKKAALEKFDSFDVIGDFVDKENQELARRRREISEVYRPSSTTPFMTDSAPGKEKSELGRELWEAASQGKAGPVKMLLAAGADPNFTVRTGLMSTSSPLVTAACRGHTQVIDSLLEHPNILVNMPVSGGRCHRSDHISDMHI